MRVFRVLFAPVLFAAALFANAVAAQTEIKLGHVGEPDSLLQRQTEEFAKRANARLGARPR